MSCPDGMCSGGILCPHWPAQQAAMAAAEAPAPSPQGPAPTPPEAEQLRTHMETGGNSATYWFNRAVQLREERDALILNGAAPTPRRPDNSPYPVTGEEARAILGRFNASHWNNPGEHARYSIPARPDYDDDVILGRYIDERERERDRLTPVQGDALERLRGALGRIECRVDLSSGRRHEYQPGALEPCCIAREALAATQPPAPPVGTGGTKGTP